MLVGRVLCAQPYRRLSYFLRSGPEDPSTYLTWQLGPVPVAPWCISKSIMPSGRTLMRRPRTPGCPCSQRCKPSFLEGVLHDPRYPARERIRGPVSYLVSTPEHRYGASSGSWRFGRWVRNITTSTCRTASESPIVDLDRLIQACIRVRPACHHGFGRTAVGQLCDKSGSPPLGAVVGEQGTADYESFTESRFGQVLNLALPKLRTPQGRTSNSVTDHEKPPTP